MRNDSLHFVFKSLGKEIPINSKISAYDKNGNILFQENHKLPCIIPVNYLASSYFVESEECIEYFAMDRFMPEISFETSRTNNNVDIEVINPSGIGFNYFVYKRNREIVKGYTQKLDTSIRMGNTKGCFISLNYQWGGEPYEKSIEIPLYKKQLNVNISQPQVIYPGQKTDIKVNVTNYKNKPVEGVDLTVFGLTKQFSYTPPTLNYYGKDYKSRTMFNNYIMEGDKNFGKSSQLKLNYQKWRPIMCLDTITYYQFTRPEKGIHQEYITGKDSITQFAPYVFENGEFKQVHFIYVDYKLVYSSISTTNNPYSFQCNDGYHKI